MTNMPWAVAAPGFSFYKKVKSLFVFIIPLPSPPLPETRLPLNILREARLSDRYSEVKWLEEKKTKGRRAKPAALTSLQILSSLFQQRHRILDGKFINISIFGQRNPLKALSQVAATFALVDID